MTRAFTQCQTKKNTFARGSYDTKEDKILAIIKETFALWAKDPKELTHFSLWDYDLLTGLVGSGARGSDLADSNSVQTTGLTTRSADAESMYPGNPDIKEVLVKVTIKDEKGVDYSPEWGHGGKMFPIRNLEPCSWAGYPAVRDKNWIDVVFRRREGKKFTVTVTLALADPAKNVYYGVGKDKGESVTVEAREEKVFTHPGKEPESAGEWVCDGPEIELERCAKIPTERLKIGPDSITCTEVLRGATFANTLTFTPPRLAMNTGDEVKLEVSVTGEGRGAQITAKWRTINVGDNVPVCPWGSTSSGVVKKAVIVQVRSRRLQTCMSCHNPTGGRLFLTRGQREWHHD